MESFSKKNETEVHKIIKEFDELLNIQASEQWNKTLMLKIADSKAHQHKRNIHNLAMVYVIIIIMNAGMVFMLIRDSQTLNAKRQEKLEIIASSLMIPSNN